MTDELPRPAGPSHAATDTAPEPRPVDRRRMRVALVVIAVLFILAFVVGTVPRLMTGRALAAVAHVDSVPTVQVTHIARAPRTVSLALPGTLEPLHQAAIYARTAGYVRRWDADIGRSVKRGEVLAVIETPDLDAQLAQGRANLEQARSALQLARTEQARWAAMVKDSVVTLDEYDQKTQAAAAAAAAAAADEADVQRLAALQSFERVTAPFDGIVTARNVDVGAFVQPGGGTLGALPSNGSTSPTSLFQLSQTDTVRVYVSVPQTDAPAIQPGQLADVRVQEFPGQVFSGRIVRTARAVDPQSRTLLTEIQIYNAKRVLLPGMYAQIQIAVDRAHPPLVVPATALFPVTDGVQVMEVDADHRVHRRTINIVRDYGAYIETDGGLNDGAVVVLNPGDGLADGTQVRVAAAPTPSDTGRASRQADR
jgi:membrane fusion protein, multidrug efflux system